MKITVSQSSPSQVIYSRLIESDPKKLGETLGYLMSQQAGLAFEANVESSGHSHSFKLGAEADITGLVLKIEGIRKRISSRSAT